MSKPSDVFGGEFFVRHENGQLTKAPPALPDVTVCRRLRDFTQGMPDGGVVTACLQCGCAVVTENRFPDTPILCMQCFGVEPVPMEAP